MTPYKLFAVSRDARWWGEEKSIGQGFGDVPEGVARVDHLPETQDGTPAREVRREDGGQEAEEDDDEGAVSEPEAEAEGPGHAR